MWPCQILVLLNRVLLWCHFQGCIISSILPSGMGARGDHGDVFLFFNLGALQFSGCCRFLNTDIHCMFVQGKARTVFFPSDTLIYSITRDDSKKFKIRTCEHMILGQLRMRARQKINAPLVTFSLSERKVVNK